MNTPIYGKMMYNSNPSLDYATHPSTHAYARLLTLQRMLLGAAVCMHVCMHLCAAV